MDYSSTLEYIFSLPKFADKPGLNRIKALLAELNNPHIYLRVVHIAGTNGKGSVASMISSSLITAGYKTGLFISPFITEFCERIQINGNNIPKEILCELTETVKSAADKLNISVGQFEFITAIAFLYYAREKCDYVVLETGLGGRYDPTNVVPRPKASVITSISLDHTELLGNNIKDIAFEKAGIIKYSVPTVVGLQKPSAMRVIKSVCKSKKSQLLRCPKPKNIKTNIGGTFLTYNNIQYVLHLCGAHQAENAALAITLLKKLKIEDAFIKEGILKASHPARLEIISKSPLVILDGAHNQNGAEALAEFLKSIKFKGSAIVASMADKDAQGIAKQISPYLNKVIAVGVKDNPRSLNPQNLIQFFSGKVEDVILANNYNDALSKVNEPLLICGSLYLASDMRPLLLERYK